MSDYELHLLRLIELARLREAGDGYSKEKAIASLIARRYVKRDYMDRLVVTMKGSLALAQAAIEASTCVPNADKPLIK